MILQPKISICWYPYQILTQLWKLGEPLFLNILFTSISNFGSILKIGWISCPPRQYTKFSTVEILVNSNFPIQNTSILIPTSDFDLILKIRGIMASPSRALWGVHGENACKFDFSSQKYLYIDIHIKFWLSFENREDYLSPPPPALWGYLYWIL